MRLSKRGSRLCSPTQASGSVDTLLKEGEADKEQQVVLQQQQRVAKEHTVQGQSGSEGRMGC